jgi:hypothetical protein
MYSLTDIDLLFDVAGWFTGDLTPPSPGVALNPPTPPAPTTTPAPTSPPTTAPPPPGPPPDPGNSVDCCDFATWQEAYNWYITYYPYYGDVAMLDADHDGILCESLPGAPQHDSWPLGEPERQLQR